MKKLLFFVVLLAGCAAMAQVEVQPTIIQLQNPSFEQGMTGWSGWGPESRVAKLSELTSPTASEPFPPAPDGSFVALAGYGSGFYQDIQVPAEPSGIYTLKFYVANYFYWYPGQYVVSVTMASFYEKPLCSASGHPLGDFEQITLACPVRDQPATTLRIQFTENGWYSIFDMKPNEALTFTPQ